MSNKEFIDWAYKFKPFYSQFEKALQKVIFKQHLMRYLFDIEVQREELEDLTHSSRQDESVVMATMSKPRDIARRIIADGRVIQGLDITAWFNPSHVREAIKRHEGPRSRIEASEVISEWEHAALIDKIPGNLLKFKWGYGRLLEKVGEAHGLRLDGAWPTKPGDDWEENHVLSINGAPDWRGARQRSTQRARVQEDPDYMEPE